MQSGGGEPLGSAGKEFGWLVFPYGQAVQAGEVDGFFAFTEADVRPIRPGGGRALAGESLPYFMNLDRQNRQLIPSK